MRSLHILSILFFGFHIVGCTGTQFSASGTTSSTTVAAAVTDTTTTTTTTTTDTATTPTAATCTSSSTPSVDLNIVSVNELSNYAAQYLYAPTNIKLTVNLHNVGLGHYGGNLQISYVDAGAAHLGTFTAAAGMNYYDSSLQDNGLYIAQYNNWFNNGANFSGFFQDGYGAIVMVIRDTDSQGCSSGAVYYRNFTATAAPQSPYRSCWFIYSGPYTCRSTTTILKTSLEPYDGYTLLGTFSGLPRAAAFK